MCVTWGNFFFHLIPFWHFSDFALTGEKSKSARLNGRWIVLLLLLFKTMALFFLWRFERDLFWARLNYHLYLNFGFLDGFEIRGYKILIPPTGRLTHLMVCLDYCELLVTLDQNEIETWKIHFSAAQKMRFLMTYKWCLYEHNTV